MGKKNRGNGTGTSAQDATNEVVGQVADNEETSQEAPEGAVIDNGAKDEGSSDVGGSGAELGAENADGELVADLPAVEEPQLATVDLEADPEQPKLLDILSPEEQAAIQEVVIPADSVTIAEDGAVTVNYTEPTAEAPVDEAPITEAPAVVQPDVQSEASPEPVIQQPPAIAEPASVSQEPAPEAEPEKPAVVSLRKKLEGKLEADALAAFDSASLTLFDEKRVMPNKTSHLEWPVDIRRTRNMNTWTDGALVDWANGEIKTPPGIAAETLHDELYRRYRLPGNWTEAAAIEFINTGKKPEATASGVLLEDRTRAAAPLHHWTFKEVKAALLGEIDTLSHKTEDLVKVLRQRMGLSNATSQDKILASLNDGTDEATMDNTLLEAKLAEYKNAMTSKGANLSQVSAGEAQVVLYNTIRKVMGRDPQTFHEGWLKLLNFVNAEYNVLFTPEKSRKGWSQMKLSTTAGRTFEDLLTLLLNTRNPATRAQDARQYKLERILQYVTEPERQNVINFYQQLGQ